MKLNGVQYLRASAIILVVAYHAAGHLGDLRPNFRFLEFGQYGVDLFFVISGFIMMVTTTSDSSPTNFIAKRLWRIVPLYWAVTAVYVILLLLAPNLLRSGALDFWYIIKSLLFIPSYDPKFPDLIWPLVIPGWSLNYEMYFYSLFAVALLLSAKYRWLIALIFLLTLVGFGQLISAKSPIVITYTNTFLAEFMFGIIVGVVFLKSNATSTKIMSLAFLLIAVTAVACTSHGINVWRSVQYGSISGAILSLLVSLEQTGATFSNATIVAIGDASYSIYLTHFAFIAFLRHIGDSLRIKDVNLPITLGALALALVGSSFLGWYIFIQFERRVMAWRNTFIKRKPVGMLDVTSNEVV